MEILTRAQIDQSFLANVASLRGKPSDTNRVSLSANTATAAIAVNTAVSRGARIPPNLRVPQDVWRVPEGYWGRYSGPIVLQPGDRLVVDGRLVPMGVDLTERLITVVCTATFNIAVGFSDVGTPSSTTSLLYAANTPVPFRAGPGMATHFRAVATANSLMDWWVSDGQAV